MKDRKYEILNSIAEQKTYHGKKRSDLKDSDFLFPETKSFPIVTPQDVPDAISNFGRMSGKMSYDAFLKKLYTFLKRKGPEFVAALPQATKDKLGIKSKAACEIKAGDKIKNANPDCTHYGSEGIVTKIEALEDDAGYLVSYKTTNSGPTWKADETLTKTADQLEQTDADDYPEVEDYEPEDELSEYKEDFFEMSVGSLKAIATHAQEILNAIDTPTVKENLTESWLQGKIAITEDYMRTIHDFIMYVTENDDTITAADKPGLWENIRKKREREGKKYKPAKPGDKDRPNPDQWKQLTKGKCPSCGSLDSSCGCK